MTGYGQTEVQNDLYEALDAAGDPLVVDVDDVTLHDIDADRPAVTYTKAGVTHRIDCDYVAGCDGYHGVSRPTIPNEVLREYEREYPFGWLGVLSETPPIDEELIYAHSDRGFALCSMRHSMLSRYYVQCSLDDSVEDWPDERFWDELRARLPAHVAGDARDGTVDREVDCAAAQLRRRTPAATDVSSSPAMPHTSSRRRAPRASTSPSPTCTTYSKASSTRCRVDPRPASTRTRSVRSARVWQAVRFSWWMTTQLHRFPDRTDFDHRTSQQELTHLAASSAAQVAFAEQYVGLAL